MNAIETREPAQIGHGTKNVESRPTRSRTWDPSGTKLRLYPLGHGHYTCCNIICLYYTYPTVHLQGPPAILHWMCCSKRTFIDTWKVMVTNSARVELKSGQYTKHQLILSPKILLSCAGFYEWCVFSWEGLFFGDEVLFKYIHC